MMRSWLSRRMETGAFRFSMRAMSPKAIRALAGVMMGRAANWAEVSRKGSASCTSTAFTWLPPHNGKVGFAFTDSNHRRPPFHPLWLSSQESTTPR